MKSQTDNTSVTLKTDIRKWVFSRIKKPAVLDLYCGKHGRMYQNVWNKAVRYLGVDKNEPHKLAPTLKATAEFAASKFDLSPFNVFDVDCYASPWIVTRRLLKRLSPGTYGFTLTSGEYQTRWKLNSSNNIIRATLGLSGFSDLRLLGRYQDLILKLMIASLGDIKQIKIKAGVMAKTGRGIAYIGIIVDKLKE